MSEKRTKADKAQRQADKAQRQEDRLENKESRRPAQTPKKKLTLEDFSQTALRRSGS